MAVVWRLLARPSLPYNVGTEHGVLTDQVDVACERESSSSINSRIIIVVTVGVVVVVVAGLY